MSIVTDDRPTDEEMRVRTARLIAEARALSIELSVQTERLARTLSLIEMEVLAAETAERPHDDPRRHI